MKAWWQETAKPWLKENWWLVALFPLGLLLLFSKLVRPRMTVVTSELQGASEHQHAVDKEAQEERERALEVKMGRIIEVQEEHAGTVAKLTGEQASEAGKLLDDPEALNSYLLQVGKDIRNDESS